MPANDPNGGNDKLQRAASQIAESWARALESMTGEHTRAQIEPDITPTAAMSWWKHKVEFVVPSAIWVGAEPGCWETIGKRILDSAGITDLSSDEVQSTFLEVVAQAIAGWTTEASPTPRNGGTSFQTYELGPPPGNVSTFAIVSEFGGGRTEPIFVALPLDLLETSSPVPQSEVPQISAPDGLSAALPLVQQSRTLDLLLEVELPLSISFGRARLPLKDVLKLTSGSIVELNRTVNEPVDVVVNNCVIARGEVVVVEGYYGIRIQQIVSRQERLRSLN